jgi:hypothetical protein
MPFCSSFDRRLIPIKWQSGVVVILFNWDSNILSGVAYIGNAVESALRVEGKRRKESGYAVYLWRCGLRFAFEACIDVFFLERSTCEITRQAVGNHREFPQLTAESLCRRRHMSASRLFGFCGSASRAASFNRKQEQECSERKGRHDRECDGKRASFTLLFMHILKYT